jgi:hypothetical protein
MNFKADLPVKASGNYMHQFQHTKTLHSAHRLHLYVPYGSHNKQLFTQTALTRWAL